MAAEWTTDQVLALAPDSGSAQSGKGLANARHWTNLGHSEAAVWGECKGSGAKPYQTRADLAGPAFKCTCPSRKFPCKHSLGLMLIYAQDKSALTQTQPPEWVTDWLASRASRAEKKADQSAEAKPPDPEQQAKRLEKRTERVAQGIEELDLWMRDLLRHGLAWSQNQPMTFWNGMAARLVDAQAPGLARQVRELGMVPASGEGWHERLLGHLVRLHLLIQAWRNQDRLETSQREDLNTAVGFTVSRELVLAQPPIDDEWIVLSQDVQEEDDGMRAQRIWLWGRRSSRAALILSFAHRAAPGFDITLPPGVMIEGSLAYYPSAVPSRALIKTHQFAPPILAGVGGYTNCHSALEAFSDALALIPWLERFPILIETVRFAHEGERWSLVDADGSTMALRNPASVGWHGLAITGGKECLVFGEWDGETLLARSLLYNGSLTSL